MLRTGNNPQRVVVVRALNGLGDLLCSVPALRALRVGLPQAEITFIGMPWARSFVERFSAYLDNFMEFPGFPGVPEQPLAVENLPQFLLAAQQRQFDLAIQLHGSGLITNQFTVLLGAKRNAGFYIPGLYCPDAELYMAYPSNEPEIWRNLRLIEFLGLPLQGDYLEFPLYQADLQAFEDLATTYNLRSNEYICLHGGASTPLRRWSPENFAQVADKLAAEGLQVVLTGSTGEAEVARSIAAHMRAPAIDLTGRTKLGVLGALLQNARLLISNDTGVAHLAAAVDVPSVVIFMASDPARWAALNRQRHRLVIQNSAPELCQHFTCSSACACHQPDYALPTNSLRLPPTPEVIVSRVLAEAHNLLTSNLSRTPSTAYASELSASTED